MKIFGHRGASAYAPENTMAAFRLAREQGAHGIEIDVHLTADGRVVVTHDFTIERVSDGAGSVALHTLAELRKFDFGARFGGRYAGERIPELGEVLKFVSGCGMMLNIEIKMNPVSYDPELIILAADMIAAEGLTDRIIISSFDHRALVDIKKRNQDIKTGILYSCFMVDVWNYASYIGADFIHPMHGSLVAECVEGCHARGIGVNAWTADDPEDILRMAAIGTDAVITNKPDVALALMKG